MSITGCDVSKYNIGWNPDNATKQIDFVIQRAGYSSQFGGNVKDEKFDIIYEQVLKIPVRGAYWYFSSWSPWKKQADKFLSIIKGKDFHFLATDYERIYNNLNARTIAEASEFVKYVKEQTGKKCLFYFSPSIYNEFIKPYGYTNWLNRQDIWIAQYPYSIGQTPLISKPNLPKEITSWVFWQYGAGDISNTAGRHAGPDYGGGREGIDLNYFNGTLDELYAWATAEEVVIPPVVIPEGRLATVIVTSVNVRSGPGTKFSITSASLKNGNKVYILQEVKDSSNNLWGRINESNWICLQYSSKDYIKYN